MNSPFREFCDTIEALACEHCNGSGQEDDADLGDIFFHTWTCEACKGTGFKDGQAYQATPIQGDTVR